MGDRIVVIGASSHGIDALRRLVAQLPADFPAPVFVVQHTAPSSPGHLPAILGRAGPLKAMHPQDSQAIVPGRIHVAPPDRHMLVDRRRVYLSHGPRENFVRPAADPLFRSAALAFGPAAIGVVLTGHLDDGTAGLLAIKDCGGTAIVQDPLDAEAPSMPRSALRHVDVDHCLAVAKIGARLEQLARGAAGGRVAQRAAAAGAAFPLTQVMARWRRRPRLQISTTGTEPDMNLASLCRREVVGIDAQASLREAATLMCEEHVGALVVVTGREPPQVVGIVTDRDLALDALGRDGDPADLRVGHLAKSPPIAVQADATLREAVSAMEMAGVRRLLVVEPDGGVVGIIAADDLLGAVSEELEGLARALRVNIRREQSERKVFASPRAQGRPVFAGIRTASAQ